MSTPVEELEQRRSVLQEEFARLGDFRLGSLIYRYRRCGKPGCRCSDPGHLGHGGWIISKKVRGTTVLSTVPHEEQLPLVRQQLEEGRRFRKLAEASDELSRRRLSETEAKATAKKGASGKRSTSRLPRRSKD